MLNDVLDVLIRISDVKARETNLRELGYVRCEHLINIGLELSVELNNLIAKHLTMGEAHIVSGSVHVGNSEAVSRLSIGAVKKPILDL